MDIQAIIGNALLLLAFGLFLHIIGPFVYILLNWPKWCAIRSEEEFQAMMAKADRWFISIPAMLFR